MHTRPGYWFISSLISWAALGTAGDAAIAAKMASEEQEAAAEAQANAAVKTEVAVDVKVPEPKVEVSLSGLDCGSFDAVSL